MSLQDENVVCGVRWHNTMRFDVQLAWIQLMLDDGDVSKSDIAEAIRAAIVKAVDEVLGTGLDGRSIPGGAFILPEPTSKMLHRETIAFDLS
jgi:hypothetical protein